MTRVGSQHHKIKRYFNIIISLLKLFLRNFVTRFKSIFRVMVSLLCNPISDFFLFFCRTQQAAKEGHDLIICFKTLT
jgi:hypothetical protein